MLTYFELLLFGLQLSTSVGELRMFELTLLLTVCGLSSSGAAKPGITI